MYISRISISGYKNAYNVSSVELNKGLNVLLGENGCGKTAVINSLRMLLRETEAFNGFSVDDFYTSMDKKIKATEIDVDAKFKDLSEDEKITFLSWCDNSFDAHLHLKLSENISKPGYYKRKYWGGKSSASAFEEDTFDRIECIYLPPLRDAEAKLSTGKYSRLALLLKKKYGEKTDELVTAVADFNKTIIENKDNKYEEIDSVKQAINKKIVDALGERVGQSIGLQFSETTFNKIIENIRMVFFPQIGETDPMKFRDLATNSLGYNNLLYIATVFSELELIRDTDTFTVLLIEEPEAHLHPQLQIKFVKYLQTLSETLSNAQIIVSTHSPVLASSVSIDKIIHLESKNDSIISTTLSQKHFGNDKAEDYINRWLDVTKSTMLFSKGVVLVEGISESLILPILAEHVLKEHNKTHPSKMANTLDEMGVSVININGLNFHYFMKLFGNFDGSSGNSIPIFCSAVTDRDPPAEVYPKKGDIVEALNPMVDYMEAINKNETIRMFLSPYKTFEYDMALDNPVLFAKVLKDAWPTSDGSVSTQLDSIITRAGKYETVDDLAIDAKFIYEHINSKQVGKGAFAHALLKHIDNDIVVPQYIKSAVLWACGGHKSE